MLANVLSKVKDLEWVVCVTNVQELQETED